MVMPAPPRPPGRPSNPTGLLALVVVVVVVVGTWWLSGGDPGTPSSPQPGTSEIAPPSESPDLSPSPSAAASSTASGDSPQTGDLDPSTGLTWVEVGVLPPEAEDTLGRIDAGGPFPFSQDGVTFENREGVLPEESQGYYHEYTVVTPGSADRGARRIVTGDPGEYFWTEDHYDSFERIVR